MNNGLHILIVEDNPGDAELIAECLLEAGLSFVHRRVETERDYLRELEEFKPDVILSDYRLPQFDGITALRLAFERYPFIPFIIVSGVLEDEMAVELLKSGAADYILKDKIARLGAAVRNALSLKAAKEEKARAEEELLKSYRELERRVQERTSELSKANEALGREVEERKKAEERIRYSSFHDEMTGLYNRAYFEEQMRRVDNDRELPISIIAGDVNNLKLTNDAFGHAEGDRLLKRIADILRIACRKSDIIARWAGDEFVVILPKTNLAAADDVCGRVSEECRKVNDMVLQPSIALGSASKTAREENIYQILRHADDNMYRNKVEKAQENQERIIAALYDAIVSKRPEINGHIKRLKEFIKKAAGAFKLHPEDENRLVLVADLHEMGKISIPEDIWLKRGKLSPQEWLVMQKHSNIAYYIARSFSLYASVIDILMSLNERWGGAGYPKGIKGADIPYLARIFAIIDAYDAMTHERVYARTFTPEETIKELQDNAGKQFDPGLVNIFINKVIPQISEENN